MGFDLYSEINKVNIIKEDRNTKDKGYFMERPISNDEMFVRRIRATLINKKHS